jgi:uncharacterized protein YdaU (DUF1376 family)
MSNRAWMPLHLDAYLADTGHLTTLEHGAYLLLIMHYWRNGGLPADERMIARLSRMTSEEWAQSRDVIASLFKDGWSHKRIDEELAKAKEIIAKRKSAANARHSGSTSNANAMHVDSKCSDTGALPLTYDHEKEEPSGSSKKSPREELAAVLDAERADAVIEHRQRLRKPLTPRAARLLAAEFAKWPDPNEAADAMVRNGWQGFEPAWMEKRRPNSTAPPRKPNAVDALQQIFAEKGWTSDEPEILPSPDSDAQCLPAEQRRSSGPVVDLRQGTDWNRG